jgi:hypothetical protein
MQYKFVMLGVQQFDEELVDEVELVDVLPLPPVPELDGGELSSSSGVCVNVGRMLESDGRIGKAGSVTVMP